MHVSLMESYVYSQLSLMGMYDEAEKSKREAVRLKELHPAFYADLHFLIASMTVLLDQEDFGGGLEALIEDFEKRNSDDYHSRIGYQVICLARREQLFRARGRGLEERKKLLARLKEAIRNTGVNFSPGLPMLRTLTSNHICLNLACKAGAVGRRLVDAREAPQQQLAGVDG